MRVEDETQRRGIALHLLGLSTSMKELGDLLKQPSWVAAMRAMFEMDDIRARLLAATAVTVVAQEMKNTPGEFERSMPRTMTPVVGYVHVLAPSSLARTAASLAAERAGRRRSHTATLSQRAHIPVVASKDLSQPISDSLRHRISRVQRVFKRVQETFRVSDKRGIAHCVQGLKVGVLGRALCACGSQHSRQRESVDVNVFSHAFDEHRAHL